jgi:cell division protein FtsB
VVIFFTGYQLYNLYRQNLSLENEFAEISGQLGVLDISSRKLRSDITYLQNSENLEKEIKSRFNYIAPGEKLIIIPKL